MTDPSKQRLIDVLISMLVREMAKVLYLQEYAEVPEGYWDDPDVQLLLMNYEEAVKKSVPDPMRNHPTAEDLRMDSLDMFPTSIPDNQR